MAGGIHAAWVMCMHCTGRAARTREGIEDDWYRCDECGREFGVDFSRGEPERPCWPPTAEELETARRRLRLQDKAKPSGSEGG